MKRGWKHQVWLVVMAVVLLAPSRSVMAGGVVVSLEQVPTDVQAGIPFTVSFVVRSMHDGRPVSDLAPGPVLIASQESLTGALGAEQVALRRDAGENGRAITAPLPKQRLLFTAQRDSEPGHYRATITLPSAGTWNWEIHPFGEQASDYPASLLSPLTVQETGSSTNGAFTDRSKAQSLVVWLPRLVLVSGITISIGVAILRYMRRKEARL